MDNDKHELILDDLDVVIGGVAPSTPKITIGNQMLSHINKSLELGIASGEGSVTETIAFCRACGRKVDYFGQVRVEGGNTSQYKCTNPTCSEFGKIKYNGEVNKP